MAILAIVWADGQVRINRYAEQISTNEREVGAMMAALRDLQSFDKRQQKWNEQQGEINARTLNILVSIRSRLK